MTAAGGNTGNGTATVTSAGPNVVEGDYKLVCSSVHSNAGVFDLIDPAGEKLLEVNTGTPLDGDYFALTISDGSSDFIIGDTFTIAVTIGGPYTAFDPTISTTQLAAGVLMRDINTGGGATQQFAIIQGPAVLTTFNLPSTGWPGPDWVSAYNAAALVVVNQLARRGIVLRGAAPKIIPS